MSECVVRMEMPKDCFECPFGIIDDTEDGVWCNALAQQSSGQLEDCPIVCALPEGHGRLVDADEIMQAIDEDIELDSRGLDDMCLTGRVRERLRMDRGYKKGFKEYMRKRPTIVPAERSET